MALLLALKLLLISTGVLFAALGVHVSVPLITDFVATHVSLTWDLIQSYQLNPPYLFLLLNAIIITIAASTMFHNSLPPPPPSHGPPPPPPRYPPPAYMAEEEEYPSLTLVDVKTVMVNGVATDTEEDNGFMESTQIPLGSAWTPPTYFKRTSLESTEVTMDDVGKAGGVHAEYYTPPASTEVAPPGMDEVWKAITEGQKMMKRPVTFDERKRERLVRKEQTLSRDELNRRVEEFIQKFNEEMRLQKQ